MHLDGDQYLSVITLVNNVNLLLFASMHKDGLLQTDGALKGEKD